METEADPARAWHMAALPAEDPRSAMRLPRVRVGTGRERPIPVIDDGRVIGQVTAHGVIEALASATEYENDEVEGGDESAA